MKKILLVVMAAVMAVSFSAFSPQKMGQENFYYEDENGDTQTYPGDPCPVKPTPICMATVNGKRVRLYTDFGLTIPLWGPGLP